ncbi:MAG: metallophosphatase domain-containing protein [Pyrinomonadaceae bacterium]|nr:metallophosphatase domain-containing protein [Pyrinomonadaceae bacterium]
MPRIVCISDTHNCNEQIRVPDGDILVHAGDATISGTVAEVAAFNRWFSGLPHKHKIFVAGNHDRLFETNNSLAREMLNENITYLQDSSVEIDGLKIYGSPWQPRFFDWAFNLMRGAELAEKWALIPDDTEILITHGPPYGILDEVPRRFFVENTGCEELIKKVEYLSGKKLKAHIFGHIHCGYGRSEKFGVQFVNASNCDEAYLPTQKPVVFDI